jgi:hypothetical protein
VAVCWWCNPLVLLELVAGAHVDALVALGAVAAVGLGSARSRWGALGGGVAVGLAAGVKLPALMVAVGIGWALRRQPWRVVAVAAGTAAVLVPAYVVAGSHAFDQTRTAARFASRSTPWRWLASALDATIGQPSSRVVLGGLAAAVALFLLWLLLPLLPRTDDRHRRDRTTALAGAAFVCYLSYLLAAPYVLGWYGAPAWALLAATAAATWVWRRPPYVWLLVAHSGALAAGYLTRDLPLPAGVAALTTALRSGLAPAVVGIVLVVTAWTTLRTRITRSAASSAG